MASEVGSAFVSVLPSARGFGSKLDSEIGGDLDGAGKRGGARFGTAFKVGALAVIGSAAVLGGFLKGAIGEAREAQKVGAITNNVIKQTGGVANVTAKQVGALATSISNKTGIDDEAIQSGANLLLTFKNVRNEVGKGNDVFNRATAAAADLSASGFGDLNGASKQLGKALNDPVAGLSALGRAGVTFTAQQKEQIKTLVASGDTLKAQKIILAEVESQVGGAAAASATYGEKAGVAFGNIKEQIGTALLPVVDGFFKLFLKSVPTITNLIDGIGPALSRVAEPVAKVGDAFGYLFGGDDVRDSANGFAEVMDNVAGNTGNLIGPLEMVGTTIRRVVTFFTEGFRAIVLLFTEGAEGADAFAEVMDFALGNTGKLVGPLRELGTAILGFVDGVRSGLTQVLPMMAETITGVVIPAVTSLGSYLLSNLLPIFAQVAGIITNNVVPIVVALATFLYGTLYPAVIQIVTAIASNLKPVFDQLFATIQGTILPVLQQLLQKFRENQPAIETIVLAIVKFIGRALALAAAILGKVLPPLIRLAGFIISNVVPAVASMIFMVVRIIAKVIEFGQKVVGVVAKVAEFVKGVKAKFTEAVNFIQDIPDKVTDALGDLGSLLKNAGKELIQGLIDGITSKLGDLGGAMGKVGDKIKGFLPGSPVKEGPLTSWNRGAAGKRLVDLLAVGLSDTSSVEAAMSRLTSRIQIASPQVALDALGSGLAVSGRSMRPIVVNDRSGSPVQTAKDVARIEAFEGAS